MPIYDNVELTPKDHMLMEYQKDEAANAREHAIVMKKLELELAREKYAGEIALKTLEAKWSSWLRLPSMVIKFPLYPLMGIAYIVHVITHKEPPKKFWDFIK